MKSQLKFENYFVDHLTGEKLTTGSPRQVFNASYSFVEPTQTSGSSLVCVSQDVAELFNISKSQQTSEGFHKLFSGNAIWPGMQPYAMCYGGHQFGQWAGQLGDGRAINLGEVVDKTGRRQTLQLKGAGLTPYSRTADGLAVLRSSVREFLCSEAMHYLGVPTTRALSLTLTGDKVMRDMFYDGNPALELGAVVCRVAPSFIRFGNFQIHASRNETEHLKRLADFSIRNNFSHLIEADVENFSIEVYEKWFEKICQSTLELMVHWMRVGFVHGVMNTDNMSILGQTIDYGPYGWLEDYDPDWTPNTTDAQGKRYSYANQPQVAHWNLFQLANAIVPLIGRVENLESTLASFADNYAELSQQMYASKLGLEEHNGKKDKNLIDELFEVLQLSEIDMTIFFRCLAKISRADSYQDHDLKRLFEPAFYKVEMLENNQAGCAEKLIVWLRKYLVRIANQETDDIHRMERMNRTNPKYVLRNYLAQMAIDKANEGDYSEIEKLLIILKNPYDEQPEHENYAAKRPEWARNRAGCSMLSCSS